MLIKGYHEKYYHVDHETVMDQFRQKYSIVGLRHALKKIVSNCTIRKFLRANPFQPRMAALPKAHSAFLMKPFILCELDCFGPFYVEICRPIEKRWGVLFTCISIRAISMKIVNSPTTNSGIITLRHFVGIRGISAIVYSDNGENLKVMKIKLFAA